MDVGLIAGSQPQSRSPLGAVLRQLVVARVAVAGGATRSELTKDVHALVQHRMTLGELRSAMEPVLGELLAAGVVTASRNRFTLSEAGCGEAEALIGPVAKEWAEVRDLRLVALALDLPRQPPHKLKPLTRPDGLRAAILARHYDLKPGRTPTPARLRAALAGLALTRAFSSSLGRGGADVARGLNARVGRRLAAELSARPRDFGTDARLVAALAAEAVGAPQPDHASLCQALLRKLVDEGGLGAAPAISTSKADSIPAAAGRGRPDLAGFAAAVRAATEPIAEGWAGSRKAYISRVWQALSAQHREWAITVVEFKAMLVEAHRTGHLALASADLKAKSDARDAQDSAIAYKNTVWHFVRLES